MKRLIPITLLTLIVMCVLFPNSIKAESNSAITIQMKKLLPTKEEIEHEGRRLPPRPIYCTISRDGINIAGLSEEIISYEIWNEASEICFASFIEESEFLDFLFSQSGDFQLIFVTENYYISGNITIN